VFFTGYQDIILACKRSVWSSCWYCRRFQFKITDCQKRYRCSCLVRSIPFSLVSW